jgi:hypothetical protein
VTNGMGWLWWAPLLAVVAHIVEEFVYPGGFADWDRAYRPEIRNSITPRLHLIVNTALIVVCINVGIAGTAGGAVSLGGVRVGSMTPPQYAVAGWLALAALLFSNAIFHFGGTVRTGRMSPGVRTGLVLYVPLAVYGFWHFLSSGLISFGAALIAGLLGGSYHVWASVLHAARARHSEPR